MLRGVTAGWNERALVDEIGARHVHFWISWRSVQPTLAPPYLALSEVDDAAVASLAGDDKRFAGPDAALQRYQGKTLVLGLGSGFTNAMPDIAGASGSERVTPDRIGRDAYIAQLLLYARATVRRYRGKVAGWQIENETDSGAGKWLREVPQHGR
ncbi:MAG: hypothetical protein KC503_42470, partial [Myxococcales bacterium]|nr:hypothetical protein [Myxococcales bacterium]